MDIYFITSNKGKLKEVKQLLGIEIKNKSLNLEEIQDIDSKKVAAVLEKLNNMQIRDLSAINDFCREYYDNQGNALAKIGLEGLGTVS